MQSFRHRSVDKEKHDFNELCCSSNVVMSLRLGVVPPSDTILGGENFRNACYLTF